MKFEINGKIYNSVELNVGTICDLEEVGVYLEMLDKAQFSFIRGYFMLCSMLNKADANRELQTHIINGGTLESLSQAIKYEVENSDFFQAMQEKTEKNTTKSKAK